MKTFRNYIIILAIALLAVSCHYYDDYELLVPSLGDYSLAGEADTLQPNARAAMEGIYRVEEGNALLGDLLVLKWTNSPTGGQLSVFGRPQGIYAIMEKGGSLDSVLIFEGYWRQAQSSETGLFEFHTQKTDGSPVLLGDNSKSITFAGVYFDDGEAIPVKFTRSTIFHKTDFIVMAHRAGGRTADRLPVSENSVAMVEFTERLGTNGIEIDVQLTKDNVPVVYHDDDLNIRLTMKSPLMGPLGSYTYEQLKTLVRLYHGERIPTLKEILEATLKNTQLKYVWLDNKNADVLSHLVPLQQAYMDSAKAQGRELNIFIGMPDQARVDAFVKLPDYKHILSLCEKTVDNVEQTGAWIWAPRWTEGPQETDIAKIHAGKTADGRSRLVFTWTLDDPNFMEQYVANTGFDAILTNYPTLLSYFYYVHYNPIP